MQLIGTEIGNWMFRAFRVFLFTVLILTEQDMNASFVIVSLNANTTRTDTVSLSSLGIAVCDHKNSSERSVNLRLAKWGVGGGGEIQSLGEQYI